MPERMETQGVGLPNRTPKHNHVGLRRRFYEGALFAPKHHRECDSIVAAPILRVGVNLIENPAEHLAWYPHLTRVNAADCAGELQPWRVSVQVTAHAGR